MTGIAKKNLSTDQQLNYYKEATATEQGLRSAIRLLEVKQAMTTSSDETMLCMVKITDLQSEVEKVHAELLAFAAETTVINPPSGQDVTTITGIVEELAQMTVNNNITTDIIKTAAELINTWQKTRA
jgi:hypothetical protein